MNYKVRVEALFLSVFNIKTNKQMKNQQNYKTSK